MEWHHWFRLVKTKWKYYLNFFCIEPHTTWLTTNCWRIVNIYFQVSKKLLSNTFSIDFEWISTPLMICSQWILQFLPLRIYSTFINFLVMVILFWSTINELQEQHLWWFALNNSSNWPSFYSTFMNLLVMSCLSKLRC